MTHYRPSTSIQVDIEPWVDLTTTPHTPQWRLRVVAGITGRIKRSHTQKFPVHTSSDDILRAAVVFIERELAVDIRTVQFGLNFAGDSQAASEGVRRTPAGDDTHGTRADT